MCVTRAIWPSSCAGGGCCRCVCQSAASLHCSVSEGWCLSALFRANTATDKVAASDLIPKQRSALGVLGILRVPFVCGIERSHLLSMLTWCRSINTRPENSLGLLLHVCDWPGWSQTSSDKRRGWWWGGGGGRRSYRFCKTTQLNLTHSGRTWAWAQKHTTRPQPGFRNWDHQDGSETCFAAAMVKCLIRITTRVNVHLRMINHCYRDVKVRVLSLGPRMLGKALGVLPLYPALTGLQESASSSPLSGTPQPSDPPGKATPQSDVGTKES